MFLDYQSNPSPNMSLTKAAAKSKQAQDQTIQGLGTYRSKLKPDEYRRQTRSGWCVILAGNRLWQQSTRRKTRHRKVNPNTTVVRHSHRANKRGSHVKPSPNSKQAIQIKTEPREAIAGAIPDQTAVWHIQKSDPSKSQSETSQTRPRIVKSAPDRKQTRAAASPGETGLRQKPGQAGPCPGPSQANEGSIPSRNQGRSDQIATMQKQEPCPVLSQVETGPRPGPDNPNRSMKEPCSNRYQARPNKV